MEKILGSYPGSFIFGIVGADNFDQQFDGFCTEMYPSDDIVVAWSFFCFFIYLLAWKKFIVVEQKAVLFVH